MRSDSVKLAALVALFIAGLILMIAAVAVVYLPAALFLAGAVCVAVALSIDVGAP